MSDRCVAANCSNVADPSKGIFVHTIPFFGDSRPEATKRRKKWKFGFIKRVDKGWITSVKNLERNGLISSKQNVLNGNQRKHSALCSVHFKPDDYVFQYALVPTLSKPSVPRLRKDKIGNLRWNPDDRTSVSKAGQLASAADVTSTVGFRPHFTRPWTRTSQLQTFIDSLRWIYPILFFIFTKVCFFFWK